MRALTAGVTRLHSMNSMRHIPAPSFAPHFTVHDVNSCIHVFAKSLNPLLCQILHPHPHPPLHSLHRNNPALTATSSLSYTPLPQPCIHSHIHSCIHSFATSLHSLARTWFLRAGGMTLTVTSVAFGTCCGSRAKRPSHL